VDINRGEELKTPSKREGSPIKGRKILDEKEEQLYQEGEG